MTDNQLPSARADVANTSPDGYDVYNPDDRPSPGHEPESLPDLHVSQMSQEDLNTLTAIFFRATELCYTSFDALWLAFIIDFPDPETVYSFFEEVEELGYYVKEEIEHPYAKEWGGSHSGVTENGTPFHMTCSKEFAESPEINELYKAIDRAAREDE